MANLQFNGDTFHYLILDCGDGSASVQWFKTLAALNLYLAKMEDGGEYGDLSEGGGSLDQNDIDNAMDEDDVTAQFDE